MKKRYILFKILKKIWVFFGMPFPGLTRFIRHYFFGKFAPVKKSSTNTRVVLPEIRLKAPMNQVKPKIHLEPSHVTIVMESTNHQSSAEFLGFLLTQSYPIKTFIVLIKSEDDYANELHRLYPFVICIKKTNNTLGANIVSISKVLNTPYIYFTRDTQDCTTITIRQSIEELQHSKQKFIGETLQGKVSIYNLLIHRSLLESYLETNTVIDQQYFDLQQFTP